MKAILVVDMPKQCDGCDFCHSGHSLRYLCGLTGNEFEYINGVRKDFCPLKPMPERMKANYDTITTAEVTEKVVAIGWNACIESILGEKE